MLGFILGAAATIALMCVIVNNKRPPSDPPMVATFS